MPIHFSIGFAVENNPKKPFESVCAVADDVEVVAAVACVEQVVKVAWPRELGECK